MVDPHSAARFPSTHWSVVVAAGDPESPRTREALTDLCQSYWFPLYAYIRRRGHDPESARDLTQELFVRVLEKGVLGAADPARGRFRWFLRGICADFLANQLDRKNALKRGGGRPVVPIADAERRYALEPSHDLTPERVFDRTWALTLISLTLDALRREYLDAGRGALFEALNPVLTDGSHVEAYATVAARLETTEGAVRVAVHRMRRRFGERLREQLSATVVNPAEVDDEIRALFDALSS